MSTSRILDIEREIYDLRLLLLKKEQELRELRKESKNDESVPSPVLHRDEIERFSRQIILPEIGTKGQLTLKKSSVLIVGAGGLGCPAAQYLCGAGVGHLGLIDYDEVEISNLHRQLLHSEETVGIPKTTSAASTLKRLNSKQLVTEYKLQLNASNALDIIKKYDVIVDATDNVATRYLLNDACVLSSRPLISGSALRLEGQLTVYGFGIGPCYRCLFPKPPPPETVTNCGDGGVLGVVPGVIGVLEALEAIKILLNWSGVLSGQLLLFSADQSTFRKVRLRNKSLNCEVCGSNPTVKHLIDYEQFCGAKATDKDSHIELLEKKDRVTVTELNRLIAAGDKLFLIDVRDPGEFEMCSLPGSLNIPLNSLNDQESCNALIRKVHSTLPEESEQALCVYVVCRRGNDSQKAVVKLKSQVLRGLNVFVRDVEGGLHSWSRTIDSTFPAY